MEAVEYGMFYDISLFWRDRGEGRVSRSELREGDGIDTRVMAKE